MACEVGIVFVSIFRPKARHRGVTPADECQAWGMDVQPLPRAATLPPPARPAKARGTPSGVHRSLPGVSVKTEIICAVVCMWHGGEQSSPNVRVAAPQRGLCRVRLTSVRPPFPFSPSFLPGAGILDGVHCVLNLALKSLDQNFLTLTGRLGRPESGRGESPHAPMSIWKPQRLPGRTGCAGDSLQRWALGSRWALPFWNPPAAPCTLHPACLGSSAPTVQCCQGPGVS